MLPRSGRFTGALLRPNLRAVRPAVPRLALSAQPILSAPPCLPLMSCRSVSLQQGAETRSWKVSKENAIIPEQIGPLVDAVEDAADPRLIVLRFEKLLEPVRASKLWFRDACQCHLCVSESSGQKRFATCDLPPTLEVDSLRVLEDGGLEVSWANDLAASNGQHVSTYPLDLVHAIPMPTPTLPYPCARAAREIWDSKYFDKDSASREISFVDWMEDSSRFAEAFCNLHRWGLVVIRGVPQREDAVEQVASRLGHLQATLYGPTWDVVSKPSAENVAYTNEFLCLHQDLLYLKEPPKIQILHCLENSCEGGESLFSDGIRAAYEIQFRSLEDYFSLVYCPMDFHYARGGHYWHYCRQAIRANTFQWDYPPINVWWSPPFQAPFRQSLKRIKERGGHGFYRDKLVVDKWREPAKAFRDSIEAASNMVQFKLQAGDCVVFDNWRILHGRRAFDTASGKRHLRGTYVEAQALMSTRLRLQREGLMFPDEGNFFPEEKRRARRILGWDGDAVTEQEVLEPDI